MILTLVKLPFRLTREENFIGVSVPDQLSCSQEETVSSFKAWSLLQGNPHGSEHPPYTDLLPTYTSISLKGTILNWKQSQLSTPRHVALSGDIFSPVGRWQGCCYSRCVLAQNSPRQSRIWPKCPRSPLQKACSRKRSRDGSGLP